MKAGCIYLKGVLCEPCSVLRRAWLYPYLCAWTLGLNKIHTFEGTIHASFLRKMWPLLSYRDSGCREFCLGCSTPLKELWPAPPTSPQSAWESSPPAVNHCPSSVLWWGSVTAASPPPPPLLNTSFHISKSYCLISSPAMPSSKESAYGCGDLDFCQLLWVLLPVELQHHKPQDWTEDLGR